MDSGLSKQFKAQYVHREWDDEHYQHLLYESM